MDDEHGLTVWAAEEMTEDAFVKKKFYFHFDVMSKASFDDNSTSPKEVADSGYGWRCVTQVY